MNLCSCHQYLWLILNTTGSHFEIGIMTNIGCRAPTGLLLALTAVDVSLWVINMSPLLATVEDPREF
jgi:hypothetical protein